MRSRVDTDKFAVVQVAVDSLSAAIGEEPTKSPYIFLRTIRRYVHVSTYARVFQSSRDKRQQRTVDPNDDVNDDCPRDILERS